MALAQIEIARVRGDGEGLFASPKNLVYMATRIIPTEPLVSVSRAPGQKAGAGEQALAKTVTNPVHG